MTGDIAEAQANRWASGKRLTPPWEFLPARIIRFPLGRARGEFIFPEQFDARLSEGLR